MIPERMLIHDLTVVTPVVSTDGFGDTTKDYGPAATRTTMRSWLQQDRRAEDRSDGRVASEQLWLLMSNTDGLLAGDSRVEWDERSLTFEVEGEPEPAYSPSGFHHLEATLRILEG